jgi:hypothetical protein
MEVALKLCGPERAVSDRASVGIAADGCDAEILKVSECDRFAALQPRGWKASSSIGSYSLKKLKWIDGSTRPINDRGFLLVPPRSQCELLNLL